MGNVRKRSEPYGDAARGRYDLVKLTRAFRFAAAGVFYTWRREQNFRIEAFIGALALTLGLLLKADIVPLVLVCALVLGLELINTAIEASLDLLHAAPHPLVERAKDAAAGAVLLASCGAVGVGLLVLGPPLWDWLLTWTR